MKPEDYIDENYVPTEEDFAPDPVEPVDEKAELRKSIKKDNRFRSIMNFAVAVLWAVIGIWYLNRASENDWGMYPLAFAFITLALSNAYESIVYNNIRRASSAREMKHHLSKLSNDAFFKKITLFILALCFGAGLALEYTSHCRWFVTLSVFIATSALSAGNG